MASVSVAPREWTYKGVTKSGWEVRWFDQTGCRRSKTVKLKKEAEAHRRRIERELEDGVHVAPAASVDVKTASAEFLTDVRARLKDGQVGRAHADQVARIFRLHLLPHIGGMKLVDLSAQHFVTLHRQMVAAGMSAVGAKVYLQRLRTFEAFVRTRGWLKTSPVADALRTLRAVQGKPIETFVPQEVAQLLDMASRRQFNKWARPARALECIVTLAALCGLRFGEILGLPVDAIDLDGNLLHVKQGLTPGREVKGPKTRAGVRIIPLPVRVVDLLRAWMKDCHVQNPLGLVFTGPSGQLLLQSNVRRQWTELLDACQLPQRHFHALRHFHASWLIANNVPVTDVARMLGHKHFDTTLAIYAHALMDRSQQIATAERVASCLPVIAAREPQNLLSA